MSLNDPVDLTLQIPDIDGSAQKMELSPASKAKKKSSVSPAFLPPCRVCNATASGYHYGANTCEACKAFFRRSIGNEDAIKPCQRDHRCADNPKGKISCSDCRHKKCLALGMAKEGCRKGRYTYEKRTQDTKEIRRMQAYVNVNKNFELEHCAESVAMLLGLFEISFPQLFGYLVDKDKVDLRVQEIISEHKGCQIFKPIYSPGHTPSPDAQAWFDAATAHILSTNDSSPLMNAAVQDMVFESWTSQSEKVFHGLATFVKGLPGFSELLIDDRIILIKQGRVDSLAILKHKPHINELHTMLHYDKDTGDLFLFPLASFLQLVGDEFVECVLRVSHRIQRLNLTIEDMAVFLGFVIFMSDREGLQRTDQVERLQDKMLPVLQYTLQKNHPEKPNMIAEVLLLLPLLRENSEINKKCLGKVRSKVRPEVTPLLAEMIQ